MTERLNGRDDVASLGSSDDVPFLSEVRLGLPHLFAGCAFNGP